MYRVCGGSSGCKPFRFGYVRCAPYFCPVYRIERFTASQVDQVLTGRQRRRLDRERRSVPQSRPLRVSPEVVHGIQLGGRLGEQPGLDLQLLPGPGTGRLVLARTILEEHRVPTAPMSTDQPQERFMRLSSPILGDQQREIAAPDIDRPMEDTLGVFPADRHLHLLADGTITAI